MSKSEVDAEIDVLLKSCGIVAYTVKLSWWRRLRAWWRGRRWRRYTHTKVLGETWISQELLEEDDKEEWQR